MKLSFVGDVMIGRVVNRVLTHERPEYPWGDTLALMSEADCRICNLECVISDRGRPWGHTPKAFHFRSDAKNVAVLEAAHIDAVSLANNHTLDFEHDAMFDMLRILDRAGILHAGAGADLAMASRPVTLERSGTRVGMIAFTDNQPEWEATGEEAGVYYVPINLDDARAGRLIETVRAAKRTVDLLIVSTHWGGNWGYSPPSEHKTLGRALIDAGADIIFGHSCHVVRGIEVYHERPILYSAGNFIDDYAVDEIERNDRSLIFMLETKGEQLVRMHLYPTVIRQYQARMAKGAEAEAIAELMRRLCKDVGTVATWDPGEQCLEIALR